MSSRNFTLVGGVSAIVAGLWISLVQIEIDIPWFLMIGVVLTSWAGALAGLFLHGRAGRLGRAGAFLSLLGIGLLFAGLFGGDTLFELEWFFSVAVNLIPAGLILHGLADLHHRSLGRASGVTLLLGSIALVWINFIDGSWPLWVEQAVILPLGLCLLILGMALLAPAEVSGAGSPSTSGRHPETPTGGDGRAMRRPWLLGAVLLPFLLIQGWVWQEKRSAIICPAYNANQFQSMTETPRPVIFDGDMAHEDLFAMLFLLQHPGVEVLGVTVAGTGEAHCAPGVQNVRDLAALHGQPDLPVACGPEAPLAGGHEFPAAWRAAADSLYGVKLEANPGPPLDISAPDLIAQIVRETPQKVTLVAVGPLTNLALAFRDHPELAPNVDAIYIMGGAVELGGNVGMSGVGIQNPVAEWNIYIDPHAANIVFEAGPPVTLVPLNATRHAPVTPEFYRCIQGEHTTPEASFVYRVLKANYDFVQSGGFQFWDSLTAAISVDNSLAAFEKRELVVIEAEGPASGQTLPIRGGASVRVATAADGNAFESLLLATLNGRLLKPPTE